MATAVMSASTVGTIMPVSTNGFPLLGNLIWYSNPPTTQHKPFVDAWDAAGLPKTGFTKVSQHEATRLGMETWLNKKGAAHKLGKLSSSSTSGNTVRSLVRVINDPDAEDVVFLVVKEEVDLAFYGLAHSTEIRMFLNKKTSDLRLTVTGSGIPAGSLTSAESDLFSEIMPEILDWQGKIQGSSIARGVRDALTGLGAVRVRDEGGLYFVGKGNDAFVEPLRGVLGTIGAALSVMPVPDTKAAKADILRNVIEGLNTELDGAEYSIKAAQDEHGTFNATVRPNTLRKRLEEVDVVRAKGEAMVALLGMHRDVLFPRIERLNKAVNDALVGQVAKSDMF